LYNEAARVVLKVLIEVCLMPQSFIKFLGIRIIPRSCRKVAGLALGGRGLVDLKVAFKGQVFNL
jgi:hypothetical protein